jgi:hypothetical protein
MEIDDTGDRSVVLSIISTSRPFAIELMGVNHVTGEVKTVKEWNRLVAVMMAKDKKA